MEKDTNMTNFYQNTHFKPAEIGEILEEWKVVKLGEVAEAEYINGFSFKPSHWEKRGSSHNKVQNLTGSTDKLLYVKRLYSSIATGLLSASSSVISLNE